MQNKLDSLAIDDLLLSGLTAEQLPCVQHVGGPLVVSAGAGSGKTLMLTKRIVYALAHPQQSGVESMDQVLAITFTNLAASEIKARVRSTLRQVGMAQQALAVDSSWISTIHAMCTRILRENALELGIDPSFSILSDAQQQELLAQAANQALSQAGVFINSGRDEEGNVAASRAFLSDADTDDDDDNQAAQNEDESSFVATSGVEDHYARLFQEHETGTRDSRVAKLLVQLLQKASNVADGLDAIVVGPDPGPARQVASRALEAFQALSAPVAANLEGKEPRKFASKAASAIEVAVDVLAPLAADQSSTYEQLADALSSLEFKFGRAPKLLAEANYEFRIQFDAACVECAAALAQVPQKQLIDLARATLTEYEQLKGQLHAMDKDDLLKKTLSALRDENGNAAIGNAYQDRFRMVLVDEFQDTSDLQIQIIDCLCGKDRARLCTVGDAQQSIYRFRGADVQTYRQHRNETLKQPGALEGRLSRNFRSHPAVISFVNKIFSQERVFGARSDEFIKLDTPANRISELPGPAQPLVELLAVTNLSNQGRKQDRTQVLAQEICRRFTDLHQQGTDWGKMVILLGKMSNADTYAQTLRAHGVPCIISGGSIFASSLDAQLVMNLACVLADPYDDARMTPLLFHDALGLSLDELLRLATEQDGRRRHLWDGLRALGPTDESPRIRLAWSTLAFALRDAGVRPVRETLEYVLLQTGWLERMYAQGAEGTARAADALKAARMAGDIQTERGGVSGISQVARQMAQDFERGMKEAPGALNVQGQNAVRIMTIHASKGLEFPVVALCDFTGKTGQSGLISLAKGPALYASLGLSRSVARKTGRWERLHDAQADLSDMLAKQDSSTADDNLAGADMPDSEQDSDPRRAQTPASFADAIAQAEKLGEAQESQRKLYVGTTRPREALIVAFDSQQAAKPKSDGSIYSNQLVEDLRRGLCGPDEDFPEHAVIPLEAPTKSDDVSLEEQSRMSVAIRHLRLSKDENGSVQVDGVPIEQYLDQSEIDDTGGTIQVPEPVDIAALIPEPSVASSTRVGEFSYSSISTDGATYAELNRRRAQQDSGTKSADWRADFDEVSRPTELENTASDTDLGAELADRDIPGVNHTVLDGGASATSLGSALHTAAQWMVEHLNARRAQGETDAALELPSEERLLRIASSWGAGAEVLPRLKEALRRWTKSNVAAQALARPTLCPETPIYALTLGPDGEPSYLNGTVDLVAYDAAIPLSKQRALAVDYKTGTSRISSEERLHERHLLQATCYAIGLLSQGFAGVDLRFVRVEAPDPALPDQDQPQVASYAFSQEDLSALEERVRAARQEAAERAQLQEVDL